MGIAEDARAAAEAIEQMNSAMERQNGLQLANLRNLQAGAAYFERFFSASAALAGGELFGGFSGGAARGSGDGGAGGGKVGSSFVPGAARGESGSGFYGSRYRGGDARFTGRGSLMSPERMFEMQEQLRRLVLLTESRNYALLLRMLGGI